MQTFFRNPSRHLSTIGWCGLLALAAIVAGQKLAGLHAGGRGGGGEEGLLGCADLLLLGIVEGLTEFIPVSSSAHLIITTHWLGLDGPHLQSIKSLCVVMQIGAIGAAYCLLWPHVQVLIQGVTHRNPAGLKLAGCLVCAFIPTGVAGFLACDWLRGMQSVRVLPFTLAGGGLVMIVAERYYSHRHRQSPAAPPAVPLEGLSGYRAVWIGVCQAFSLIPGTSRSMTSMAGGYTAGLNREDAIVFSFLLGIVTITAASAYEMVSCYRTLAAQVPVSAWLMPLAGSFFTALAIAPALLRFLLAYGLIPFALYRFILAAYLANMGLGTG